LTAGVMTYVTTELRRTWQAVFTFVFILTIPAVVGNVTQWWHPDALMMLMVALTFLFLKLDKMRLGSYFYLAAGAVGMAASIKLVGFFFFLAIPLYILIVWRRKGLPFKKALRAAAGFVLVMAAVIVLSNPFLFYEGPRNDMLAIQAYKAQELRYGYDHEENIYYRLGPQYWRWTIETSYGSVDFPLMLLGVLALSVIANPKDTDGWMLLAWMIPMGIYLMWFVSPKPDHYLLPVMLPLYATVTVTFDLLEKIAKAPPKWAKWIAYTAGALWIFLAGYQFVWQINDVYERYLAYFIVG